MRVRLIKKFADVIDGVDLHGHDVGDVLNLKRRDAKLLLAEQWAVVERLPHRRAASVARQTGTQRLPQ